MLKRLSKIVVLGAVAGSMQLAFAARQCLALPGTYGAVTVTGCENDPANGIFNPVSTVLGADYPYDGVALGQMSGNLTCTYGFSHSIASNSITIDVDIINPVDRFSVELDSQPYAFTASDIVVTPLPLSTMGTETIEAQGGAVQNAASTSGSSGTVRLGASAPARISTLKLNMDSSGGGGPTRVCIDDAAVVVPPSAPTPVPSTSLWSLLALGPMIGLAGIAGFSRRRKQ